MESSSMSLESVSAADLKTELQSMVSQMQRCCCLLRFSSWKLRCQILLGWVLVLPVVSMVTGLLYGPGAGGAVITVCVLGFPLLLYGLCVKLPRSGRLLSDLRRLSVEFSARTAELKQHVDNEVWVRALSTRWSCVQELEKTGREIHGYVETMGSIINPFLISELKKKLKESQKHLHNI